MYVCTYVCMYVGDPFRFHYWVLQCGVYLLVMVVEKVCVGPLTIFHFWNNVSYNAGCPPKHDYNYIEWWTSDINSRRNIIM